MNGGGTYSYPGDPGTVPGTFTVTLPELGIDRTFSGVTMDISGPPIGCWPVGYGADCSGTVNFAFTSDGGSPGDILSVSNIAFGNHIDGGFWFTSFGPAAGFTVGPVLQGALPGITVLTLDNPTEITNNYSFCWMCNAYLNLGFSAQSQYEGSPAPEPATWAAALAGLGIIGLAARRLSLRPDSR
jgi:hypothetical protein